jgi:hypothetical protein
MDSRATHLSIELSRTSTGCDIPAEGRLEGLSDEPRPGRPRTISDEHVEKKVIAATMEQEPPNGDTHWSTRSMAFLKILTEVITFGATPEAEAALSAMSALPRFLDRRTKITAAHVGRELLAGSGRPWS